MRIGRGRVLLGAGAIVAAAMALLPMATLAEAGPVIRLVQDSGGGGMTVDLAVRQVTVQPVRAIVGDVIRIEVWVQNRFDGRATTPAEVRANGKVVGSQLIAWGDSAGARTYKLMFDWNTRGQAPGEYKIRATAFVFEDTAPFDNELEARQPVILVAPGGEFPGGEKAGGSFTETDPRYKTDAGG